MTRVVREDAGGNESSRHNQGSGNAWGMVRIWHDLSRCGEGAVVDDRASFG